MASEIKYRVKQIGKKYCPQEKSGLFSKWNNLPSFVAHIVTDGALRISMFTICFNSLEEAKRAIDEYRLVLINSDHYRGHYFIPCSVDNYSLSKKIYVDLDSHENGLYYVWHEHLKDAKKELDDALKNVDKDTTVKIYPYKK